MNSGIKQILIRGERLDTMLPNALEGASEEEQRCTIEASNPLVRERFGAHCRVSKTSSNGCFCGATPQMKSLPSKFSGTVSLL
jgi:hypothetical protein